MQTGPVQTIRDCAFCIDLFGTYINGRMRLLHYCLIKWLDLRVSTPFFFHFTVSFSDKGRSQKTPTTSPSPGSQKMLQFDSIGNTAERVKSPAGFSGSTGSGLKPNLAFPDLSLGTSRSVAGAAPGNGELFY